MGHERTDEFDAAAAGMRYEAACEAIRPSTIYRPRLFPDGNQWCALYGDDLQEGVCGFGKSPAAAMRAFDEAWVKELSSPSTVAAQVTKCE